MIEYERKLLDVLPTAYDNIRIARRRLQAGEPTVEAAEKRRDDLISELERVHQWLDAFVRSAEEYVAARPERRGHLLPPPLPSSARKYESIEAFVAENLARGVKDWETRKVAAGADFGYDWTWQDPGRPWVVGTWRVSYIDELKEVYACENAVQRYTPYVSFDGEDSRPRGVVLLASDFEIQSATGGEGDEAWLPQFFSWSPTWELLSELQRTLMRQRNSLVLLANALVEAQRTARAEPSPSPTGEPTSET